MIALHIGLKKSGSASIQSFLAANEGALGRLGLHYPPSGRGPFRGHHNIACELMARRKYKPEHGGVEDLVRSCHGADRRVDLLSSEMFEECETDQITALKRQFDPLQRDYRIILYIRDLVSLMPSSYAQKIRYGAHAYGFDEFFAARMNERRVNYFRTAQRWAAVFGWPALRVRLLEPEHLTNGELIDDLLEVLDFNPNARSVSALRRPGVVNASPGWRVLEAIRGFLRDRHGLPAGHPLLRIRKSHADAKVIRLSVHTKLFARATHQAGEELGWNGDRGLYLSLPQARRCWSAYEKTLRQFARVLDPPLPRPIRGLTDAGFEPRPWVPSVRRVDARELRAFYDRAGELLNERGLL